MAIEKGILTTLAAVTGVVFVGLVGYKVIKKKKPELFEKTKKSVSNVQKRTSEIIEGARKSFREGYARA